MRPDLAKLTTEQERAGGYGKIKYGGRVRINQDSEHEYPDEFGGFRSSARHRHTRGHTECKNLTDVLNPLRGAIRKNLGRPWDAVYSEFCEVLDRRSVSGFHIWGHLKDEVDLNTYLAVDGNIYARSRWGRVAKVSGFYVHPVSGLLLYAINQKYDRKGHQPIKALPVPGMEPMEYRKIEGLWFRCVVKKRKVLAGSMFWNGRYEEFFEEKQSCNKKEIRWIKSQIHE